MVVVSDGEIVDFGEKNERTWIVSLLEGEFALFLVQVPDFSALMTGTTNNPRVI